jgi:CRISPR/Cas system-associated protein Cas10 (large subunit of type III CRISPR-Cas system)
MDPISPLQRRVPWVPAITPVSSERPVRKRRERSPTEDEQPRDRYEPAEEGRPPARGEQPYDRYEPAREEHPAARDEPLSEHSESARVSREGEDEPPHIDVCA